MIVQNVLLAKESYTHADWVYRDICVSFSRIYYIIDGEAYYEEDGKRIRFKKNHLYLTPVDKPFTLFENAENKLLHTYAHIHTLPVVDRLIEIPVVEGTPLADGVALWRKYANNQDLDLILSVLQFVLNCLDKHSYGVQSVEHLTRAYLEGLNNFSLDMKELCSAIGYSREYVTRKFSAAYHVTPKEYVTRLRMDCALKQLQDGFSVGAVAESVGFSTSYAFSKAFKQHFGLSPKHYVKNFFPR